MYNGIVKDEVRVEEGGGKFSRWQHRGEVNTVRGQCHIINNIYDTVYSVYYTLVLGKITFHQMKVLGTKCQID